MAQLHLGTSSTRGKSRAAPGLSVTGRVVRITVGKALTSTRVSETRLSQHHLRPRSLTIFALNLHRIQQGDNAAPNWSWTEPSIHSLLPQGTPGVPSRASPPRILGMGDAAHAAWRSYIKRQFVVVSSCSAPALLHGSEHPVYP